MSRTKTHPLCLLRITPHSLADPDLQNDAIIPREDSKPDYAFFTSLAIVTLLGEHGSRFILRYFLTSSALNM